MFDDYKQMTDDQKAAVKAIHKAIREAGCSERYNNLAWGFVRGFQFRRIERTHRMDGQVEHNLPSAYLLAKKLSKHIPGVTEASIQEWLDDPAGAIPAPVRVKKPYVQPVEGAA